MGNRTIPLDEKSLVIERLARGSSTREAIMGTSIRSNSTAAKIAKSEKHIIAQRKEEYLDLIQDYAFNSRIDRARLWGEALGATKRLPVKDTDHVSYAASRDGYISVPDWSVRLRALMYLDMIEGIVPSPGVRVNVIQQINKNR